MAARTRLPYCAMEIRALASQAAVPSLLNKGAAGLSRASVVEDGRQIRAFCEKPTVIEGDEPNISESIPSLSPPARRARVRPPAPNPE